MLDDGAEIIARSSIDRVPNSSWCLGDEPLTVVNVVAWTFSVILRGNGNCPGEYVHVKSTAVHPAPDGNDAQDKTRDQKIADYAQSKGWTRAADGGWNTNPGGVGWASNEKVGEEMDYVNSGRGNVQPLTLGSGPSEIKAYEPSWTERIESSVQSGLMSLGMDKYQALQWGEKVGTLAGFVPGVGSGLSGNESYRAYASGHPVLGTIHAVGALPLPGAGKLAEKLGVKAAERAAEKAAIRETEEKVAEKAVAEQGEVAKTATKTAENGARSTRRTRTVEELLPNGRVPGVRNGEFNKWFDDLTPDELDELWKDPKIRETIKDRIRDPGGLHEWFMVSRTPTFKKWGVPMQDIKDLRTLTSETGGVNPDWVHGGVGSTRAHNELLNIIDNSLDRNDFVRQLNNWANYRLKNGIDDLPHGLRLEK